MAERAPESSMVDVAEARRLAQEIKNLVEFRLSEHRQSSLRLQILTLSAQLLNTLGATDA